METKIKEGNIIIKEMIKKSFKESSWAYTDFVKEDRFITEIQADKNINISENTAEELAEYAYDNIVYSSRRSNLLGF